MDFLLAQRDSVDSLFQNQGRQTLFEKFKGVFENNPDIHWFDALVGQGQRAGVVLPGGPNRSKVSL